MPRQFHSAPEHRKELPGFGVAASPSAAVFTRRQHALATIEGPGRPAGLPPADQDPLAALRPIRATSALSGGRPDKRQLPSLGTTAQREGQREHTEDDREP